MAIVSLLAIGGVVALTTNGDEGDRTQLGYPTIGPDLGPLRAAFNADPGNVRAVLLASPT